MAEHVIRNLIRKVLTSCGISKGRTRQAISNNEV